MSVLHICPVCGFPDLEEEPRTSSGGSYEICPSCGFQFGVTDDDAGFTYADWRGRWVQQGMEWDGGDIDEPPADWDPADQLDRLLNRPPG